MNTVNKLIKGDRIPTLRNLVLFPILVSLDKDESLEVSVFSFPIEFIAFVLLDLPVICMVLVSGIEEGGHEAQPASCDLGGCSRIVVFAKTTFPESIVSRP